MTSKSTREASISTDSRSPIGVVLTYNAREARDGLGAQAQRLMGIYSAVTELGFNYMHSPIQFIERNPGDPPISESERIEYLRQANELLDLPGIAKIPTKLHFTLDSLTLRRVRLLKVLDWIAKRLKVTILVQLPSSLPWSDTFPDTYRWASQIIRPRFAGSPDSSLVTIDVHIRRAVSPARGRDGNAYDRYISTEWYQKILDTTVTHLQQRNMPARIRIHTDIPRERWQIPLDTSPGTLAMWKHHNFVDDDGYLIDMSEDLERQFAQFGSVEIAQEWSPLDALTSMVQADMLIICASSFSYVAGLLRSSKLTVSPRFFHSSPANWQLISAEVSESEQTSLRQAMEHQFA